jgi:hypothetical protein
MPSHVQVSQNANAYESVKVTYPSAENHGIVIQDLFSDNRMKKITNELLIHSQLCAFLCRLSPRLNP